jgi:hypothetical protein
MAQGSGFVAVQTYFGFAFRTIHGCLLSLVRPVMNFIDERDMIHGEIRQNWRRMRITFLMVVAG